jgi:hypothetical protein
MPLPEQPIVIEFRDGERSVPAHVAKLIAIAELDPSLLTYEQAVEKSNNALLKKRLNDSMWKVIGSHFAENR